MAFVEAPRFDNRKPFAIHRFQNQVKGMDGSLEVRRVADVKIESSFRKRTASLCCFFATGISEVNIHPAGEEVQLVPLAFSMANKNELHGRVCHKKSPSFLLGKIPHKIIPI